MEMISPDETIGMIEEKGRKDIFDFGGKPGDPRLQAAGAFAIAAFVDFEISGSPLTRVLDDFDDGGSPLTRGLESRRPDLDPISRLPKSETCDRVWRKQVELRADRLAADADAPLDADEARRVAENDLKNDVRDRFAWFVAERARVALIDPESRRAPRNAGDFVDLFDVIREAHAYVENPYTKELIAHDLRELAASDAHPPTYAEGPEMMEVIAKNRGMLVESDAHPPTSGGEPTGSDKAVGWDEEAVIFFDEYEGRYDLIDRADWEMKFEDGPAGPGRGI